MNLIGSDIESIMTETSEIDASMSDCNEIKITLSDAERQQSMAADARQPARVERQGKPTGGNQRRTETVFGKIQFNHNNIVFLLVPLLLMILKETSALPPIIKIGEWQIFPFSFQIHTHTDSHAIQ